MKLNVKEKIKEIKIEEIIMIVIIIAYTFFMEIINKNVATIVTWLGIQLLMLITIFKKYWNKKILICLMVTTLLLCIYVLINPTYSKSITYCALIYFNLIISAMIWKAYFNCTTEIKTEKVLATFSVCGLILSFAVIIESILKKNVFFDIISRYNSVEIIGKSNYVCFGSMGNHIVLTMYLWFIFIISYYLFTDTKKKKFAIFSTVNIIAIFMSGSRTGYVFSIGLIFLFFIDYILISIRQRNNKKIVIKEFVKIIFLIFIILTILVILFNSGFNSIISRFSSLLRGREKASLTHRISAIIVTMQWFFELNPIQWFIGSGYGMLTAFLERNNLSSSEMSNFYIIDNQWMSILYNNGIIVFAVIAIIVFKNLFEKGIFDSSKKNYSILCQALFLLIGMYMFSFDAFTWMASTSIIGFCYVLSTLKDNLDRDKMY